MKRSNWSAGRTSQRKRAVCLADVAEAVHGAGGDGDDLAGPGDDLLGRPRRNSSVPSSTSKRSVWNGWTCAAATAPSGSTRDLDLDELAVGVGSRLQEREWSRR